VRPVVEVGLGEQHLSGHPAVSTEQLVVERQQRPLAHCRSGLTCCQFGRTAHAQPTGSQAHRTRAHQQHLVARIHQLPHRLDQRADPPERQTSIRPRDHSRTDLDHDTTTFLHRGPV
jgi:hypothetical protein